MLVKNRFVIALVMSVMVGMMTGFFWTPLSRVYDRAGFEGLVPFIPLFYGVGSLLFIWFYTKKALDPEKWIFISALGLSGVMWGMAVTFKWPSFLDPFLLTVFPGLYGGFSGMLFTSTSAFYRTQLSRRAKAHQRGAAFLSTIFAFIYLSFNSLSFWVMDRMLPIYVWTAMAACAPLVISIPAWFIFPKNPVGNTACHLPDNVQKKQEKERPTDKKTKEPLFPILALTIGPYTLAGYVLGYGFLNEALLWALLATPAMLAFWHYWMRLLRQKQQMQNQKQIVLTPRLFWLLLWTYLPSMTPVVMSALYVPLLLKNVAWISFVLSGTFLGAIVGEWVATLIPAQYNRQTLTFSYVLTGTGLTLVAMQTTVTPMIVFSALFLNASAQSLLSAIQSQLLFHHMEQKTGAVGVVQLMNAIVYLMVFAIGWMTQKYDLPYKDIWGMQLLLLPAAAIALYYLVQYFRVQEEQSWKECRDELMQPIVKVIRTLALVMVIYTSRPASLVKKI
jgi:MFS family permease